MAGMTWEGMRYESDRAVREGEYARDRRAAQHRRELEVARERPERPPAPAPRVVGWLARAAQATTSWLA